MYKSGKELSYWAVLDLAPDHLLEKIRNSVISPKPLCEELLFIWKWRDFIKPNLSERKLENNSFLHSFMVKKESGVAVLRAKKYPKTVASGFLIRHQVAQGLSGIL